MLVVRSEENVTPHVQTVQRASGMPNTERAKGASRALMVNSPALADDLNIELRGVKHGVSGVSEGVETRVCRAIFRATLRAVFRATLRTVFGLRRIADKRRCSAAPVEKTEPRVWPGSARLPRLLARRAGSC